MKLRAPQEIAKQYGVDPSRGFPTSTTSSNQEQGPSGLPGILMSLFGPEARSVQNIGTAATTIPQAFLSSAVSRFNPQMGAQIASKDILGTQSRAQEISANPQEAVKRQLIDSGTILAEAGAGKLAGKAVDFVAPGRVANKLTQQGIKKAAGKTVPGNQLALEFINEIAKEKAHVVSKPAFKKGLISVIDEMAGKEIGAQELQDLFIKYGSGFTQYGAKAKATDAAVDRVVRRALRTMAKTIDAEDVIKSTEQVAKSRAKNKLLKAIAEKVGYTGLGVGTGLLGSRLFGSGGK